MLENGKLYLCEDYSLLLYPDPETAAATESTAAATVAIATAPSASTARADAAAAYWTRKLGKSVSYTDKNIPLLILNNREKYVEVLAGDRKGWIIFNDYLNIKEIDYA